MSITSTQISLDFRNDLKDLKSPYQVKFPINHELIRIKLQSCQIPATTNLGSEPYIYLQIEELEGDYLMPNGLKAFGKLILIGDRQGYLYYQPDTNSCDLSLQRCLSQLTLQFCDYQGQPIHLEQIPIVKTVRSADRLKLQTDLPHGLRVNEPIRIEYINKADQTRVNREIQIKSLPSLKTFTFANPGNLISSRGEIRVFRKALNCSLSFQVWESTAMQTASIAQKSIQLVPFYPEAKNTMPLPSHNESHDFVQVTSAPEVPRLISQSQSCENTLPLQKYPVHKQRDSYSIMGIPPTATPEEITSKYHELYLLYHPEKDGDWFKFLDLQLAYASILNGSAKYTLPDFERLTKEYRDETGEGHRDLGYSVSCDDWVRASGNESFRLRMKFDTEFEERRSADDKLEHTKFKDLKYPESYLKHKFTSTHIPCIGVRDQFHKRFIGEAMRTLGLTSDKQKIKGCLGKLLDCGNILSDNETIKGGLDQLFNGENFGGMGIHEYTSQQASVSSEHSLFDLSKKAIIDLDAKYCKNPETVNNDMIDLIDKIMNEPEPIEQPCDCGMCFNGDCLKMNSIKIAPEEVETEEFESKSSDFLSTKPRLAKGFNGQMFATNDWFIYQLVIRRLNDRIGNLESIYPITQFHSTVYKTTLVQELTEHPVEDDEPFNVEEFLDRLINRMIEALLLNQVNNPINQESNGEEWLVV